MNNEVISIIGGKGFLGSSIADLYDSKNTNVRFCDLANLNEDNFYVDVEDPNTLDVLKGSSVIINLAAMHRDDVKPISRYDEVNIDGAKNVCDAAERFGIKKIIFTSSVAIYGFAPINTDEKGEPNYFNDYGRTKFLAEQVYKNWQSKDSQNRSLIIIRPTVIFGKGNRGNVYNLFNSIYRKRFVMIGSGTNTKSMAYVENVAAFVKFSLSFGNGLHVYNYIDKPDFNMNKLVDLCRFIIFGKKGVGVRIPKFLGFIFGYLADFFSFITSKNIPISSIRVKKFTSSSQFTSSIDKTSFTPPYSLEEGLIKTLNYEFNSKFKDVEKN